MQAPPFDEQAFLRFFRTLDERRARLCAAERALALGWGGITRLARVTGLSRETVRKGIAELRAGAPGAPGRVRRPGGGRKRVEAFDPALLPALQAVVDGHTGGSPEDALKWTPKSKAALAAALAGRGHRVAPNTVGRLLRDLGYSLQATRKDKEGRAPPERDAQVRYLNAQVRAFLDRGQPVLSVDTKKKELVGEFKNAGRTWRPTGAPVRVNVHDFPSQAAGKAIPHGVYDVGQNRGFVNVGTSHDTPAFAVESLRLWWEHEGRARYPATDGILLCADSGGSNGTQSRVWKARLQGLADQLRVPITVCHLPPGTSKWNKIEHRLFSYISIHWRGRPLVDYETMVSLIGATSTTTGLTVTARLGLDDYPTGVAVPGAVLARLALHPHAVHPQWNYTLAPRPP
jgi:DDE family transposase